MNHAAGRRRVSHDPTVHLTALLLCSIVLVAAVVLQIDGGRRVVFPGTKVPLPGVCWFRQLLHIDCPGCGLTRSFISLAHGRLREAWTFHAAGPLVFALAVAQLPYQSWQLWRIRRGLAPWKWGRAGSVPLMILAGALFAQWLARLCAYLLG